MKKTLVTFSCMATFVIAMVCWGGLAQAQQSGSSAQSSAQDQQQTPDPQAPASRPSQSGTQGQQAPDQAQESDASGSKDFVGTVVKQGDKYMFQDAATGTTYDIDHQDEVKKFEGKKVRVHGALDPNGKMIHVQ